MRDYACLAPTFWTRGTGKRLRGHKEAQLLALYLFSCPSAGMTGVFGLGLPVMAHETGLTIEEVEAALVKLAEEDCVYYDRAAELVYVVKAVVHQVGPSLTVGDNGKEDRRASGIRKEIKRIGMHPFSLDFGHRYYISHLLGLSPFEAPWKGLTRANKGYTLACNADQDQDQDQEQDHAGDLLKPDKPDPKAEPDLPPGSFEALWHRTLRRAGAQGVAKVRPEDFQAIADDARGKPWLAFCEAFAADVTSWVTETTAAGQAAFQSSWRVLKFLAWRSDRAAKARAAKTPPPGESRIQGPSAAAIRAAAERQAAADAKRQRRPGAAQ